jgi:tRNA G18 (ribose-2'-O)-methylase SpoU
MRSFVVQGKANLQTMETNSVVFFNDRRYAAPANMPVIAAWQIINPENIGNLIRLADNVGAGEVIIIGENFQLRQSSIAKTAGLSFRQVRLSFVSPDDFFAGLNPEYLLVAIETSEDSKNIYEIKLPEKIVFLLGNERNGLPVEILEKCHQKIHIPMTGKCKSMNVSHALAVALFEWQRQMLFESRFWPGK